MVSSKVFLSAYIVCLTSFVVAVAADDQVEEVQTTKAHADLDSSATSARLLNWGGLFGQYPSYGYGSSGNWSPYNNGYRPNTYRPNYYTPSTYYPTINGGGTVGQYPNQYGLNQYPNQYPISWSGSQYPNNGFGLGSGIGVGTGAGGFYPNTGTGGTTNFLGGDGGYRPTEQFGGYGGYGGNGGLRQYAGYLNPGYVGQRNRGYGYLAGTDRYGLPQHERSGSRRDLGRDRDHVDGGYRGYD